MIKTNVMRILDKKKIEYKTHEYSHEGGVDGVSVAQRLNQDPNRVFKTLVTQGADKNFYVFVIPVNCELDLKSAAKSAGVKSVAMIHVADINKITGYIRGGCSPIGMKKQFKTVIHLTAFDFDSICVSAGKIGAQVDLNAEDLMNCINATKSDIIMKNT